MAKRNVTITLDEETAEWARIEAARRDTSMSRLVGSLLHEHMLRERNYESARREFLSGDPAKLKHTGAYPGRDEVHSRNGG